MIIDLHSLCQDAGLFSKLVWQVMFDFYRINNGDLANMHDLLCDLTLIKGRFDTWKDFTFYWSFTRHITDFCSERETYKRQLKVQYFHVDRKVEITVCEVEGNRLI